MANSSGRPSGGGPFTRSARQDPDSHSTPTKSNSLEDYRQKEGRSERKRRLLELWERINNNHGRIYPRLDPQNVHLTSPKDAFRAIDGERAQKLTAMYEEELAQQCHSEQGPETVKPLTYRPLPWKAFVKYAEAKEQELWNIFHELDLDGNGYLEESEMATALRRAGITLSQPRLDEFVGFLTNSHESRAITFPEFRGFLLLLPRQISAAEIYQYYEVRKYLGDDGRGSARVTMEGDVILSGEDHPPILPGEHHEPHAEEDEDHEHDHDHDHGHGTAFHFLLAGGIAGVVSRTCTAPFDRLKVFLITRNIAADAVPGVATNPAAVLRGTKAIWGAITRIYVEGGVLGFWVGNGLSVAKIFPESAIKFFSYETAKRFFAEYVDGVDDPRHISGTSRFISGGIGGIMSQLSIYPVETLKTQMMSSSGEQKQKLIPAVKHLWSLGGARAYYRGLLIGLVGVFPYAAIDMSSFEALKLAYLQSTGKEEPGMLPLLAFGSVSGSFGATCVYPLNLMRTRLQASGSLGYAERYTGIKDVAVKTFQREGWRGFYRGLFPTLAKVIPSVSISYVVYEESKKRLGV